MSSKTWTCATCTLSNTNARTICEACGAKRPVSTRKKPKSPKKTEKKEAPARVAKPTPPPASSSRPKRNGSGSRRRVSATIKKKPTAASSSSASNPVVIDDDDGDDENVNVLIDIGFDRATVKKALAANGNDRQRALDWLLANRAPSPSKSRPSSSSKTKASAAAMAAAAAEARAKLTANERKALEQRQQLEKKLEEEERERQKAFAAAEIAKHAAMREKLQEKRREEERQKRLERLEREKAASAKRLEDMAERARRRAEQERTLTPNTQAALQYLEENYDVPFVHSVAKFIAKVIGNILNAPNDEKYRTIRLDHARVVALLQRPLGPMVMMKELGFAESVNPEGKPVLVMKKVNKKLLRERAKLFDSLLLKAATIVPHAFRKCDEMKGATAELLYYCALDLRRAFQNVLTNSDSQNFRQIDTESSVYHRLSKFPPLVHLLREFGYAPESDTSVFLEVRKPQTDKFEAAVVELTQELNARAPKTPVSEGVRQLLRCNAEAIVSMYVEKLDAALSRIINVPHEQKYHRMKLAPFFKRMGVVDGGKAFMRVFNLEIDDVAEVATMPYPCDIDLLEHRLHELRRAYKVELLAMRTRRPPPSPPQQ